MNSIKSVNPQSEKENIVKSLKDRIIKDGYALSEEIIKVDSFLNHQIDPNFMMEIGAQFAKLFEKEHVTKVLTIEASGIAIGAFVAYKMNIPLVFAKKTKSRNLDKKTYSAKVFSFTKQTTYDIQVSERYLDKEDRVLIIDDFLANGKALEGLIDVVEQSGAYIAGIGIVIEKGFQEGGKLIREQGYNLKSLAIIDRMSPEEIVFR